MPDELDEREAGGGAVSLDAAIGSAAAGAGLGAGGVHKGLRFSFCGWTPARPHPGGYQYSRFCDRYRGSRGRLDVGLRQVFRAREKEFVDYAGPMVEVTDRRTGEIHKAKCSSGCLRRRTTRLST